MSISQSTLPAAIRSVLGDLLDEDVQPTEAQIQHLIWSDGLLMAVAIAPVRTEPEDWLAAMHGRAIANFRPELIEAVHGMNLMRIDQIGEDLHKYGPRFEAIVETHCDQAALLVRAEHWASGFLEGMRLRYDAWEPMLSDPVGRSAFAPLLAFLKSSEGVPLLGIVRPDSLTEARDEALHMLGESVFKMHLFWQEYKEDRRRHGGRLGKVGRNEPCPCGSGQKYKRCCLN